MSEYIHCLTVDTPRSPLTLQNVQVYLYTALLQAKEVQQTPKAAYLEM